MPWLRTAVETAVRAYASGITVSGDRIQEALSGIDPSDPQALQGIRKRYRRGRRNLRKQLADIFLLLGRRRRLLLARPLRSHSQCSHRHRRSLHRIRNPGRLRRFNHRHMLHHPHLNRIGSRVLLNRTIASCVVFARSGFRRCT